MINAIGNIIGGGSARISYAKQLAKAYAARVIADGGVVESLGCFTAFAKALGAFKPTLLLDFYQNAAAAYSLRKLSTTYTGDAIRVRRASDNTELNIGFVNNELDTASLTTFCSGTDGFVKTWYDQSGNTRNAAQTTAANQPQIVSSGSVITQGGKPSMRFDGSNDALVASVNNPFSFTGGVSLIHASYKNSSAYKAYETILSAGTTGDAILNLNNAMSLGYGNTAPSPLPTITTDIWAPSGIQYDGTIGVNERQLIGFYISNWSTHRSTGLSNLTLNNSDLATKTYGSANPLDLNTNPIKIGVFDELLSSSFFGGDIQEIIAYASDQNSNRTGIETNINDFYSIY
ncbi:MAG TPA: arabinofuranosidase catalytic domain-containing protein [archaeon]|nr:arabinofuranosidase catalytic domain-containing protein [archaeon]